MIFAFVFVFQYVVCFYGFFGEPFKIRMFGFTFNMNKYNAFILVQLISVSCIILGIALGFTTNYVLVALYLIFQLIFLADNNHMRAHPPTTIGEFRAFMTMVAFLFSTLPGIEVFYWMRLAP
jgi:hypothetical protein